MKTIVVRDPLLGEVELVIFEFRLKVVGPAGEITRHSFRFFRPTSLFFPMGEMMRYIDRTHRSIPDNYPEEKEEWQRKFNLAIFYFLFPPNHLFIKRKLTLAFLKSSEYVKGSGDGRTPGLEDGKLAGAEGLKEIDDPTERMAFLFGEGKVPKEGLIFKYGMPVFGKNREHHSTWDKILDITLEVWKESRQNAGEVSEIENMEERLKAFKLFEDQVRNRVVSRLKKELSVGNDSEIFENMKEELLPFYFNIVFFASRSLYKNLRPRLTYPEKRAFILAYLTKYARTLSRTLPNNEIPLIWGPNHMSDFYFETKGSPIGDLIQGVVIYKLKQDPSLAPRLKQAWEAFLNYYPIQVLLQQTEDKESYQRDRVFLESEVPKITSDGAGRMKEESIIDLREDKKTSLKGLDEKVQRRMRVEDALRILNTREKKALEMKTDGYVSEEIGRKLGVSRQRADQIIEKATKKLRKKLEPHKLIR